MPPLPQLVDSFGRLIVSDQRQISRTSSNPFDEGSRGFLLWKMGYKNRKLVEDSLARSSTLEGSLDWILERQGGTTAEPERTYECPIYGDEVTLSQLHIFSW